MTPKTAVLLGHVSPSLFWGRSNKASGVHMQSEVVSGKFVSLAIFFSKTTKLHLVSEKQGSVKMIKNSAIEKCGTPPPCPASTGLTRGSFSGKRISEFPVMLLIKQRGHVALSPETIFHLSLSNMSVLTEVGSGDRCIVSRGKSYACHCLGSLFLW